MQENSDQSAISSDRKAIIELFILSFLSLYVELLIIRWMSADIRAFTVFHTFPLITCFVGLGVGFALRRDTIFRDCLPAMFLFAFAMKIANFVGVCFWGFPSVASFQWQKLVGLMSQTNWAYLAVFALTIILLLAGPFAICVCIGARLGVLFNKLKPLPAYCYNVGGAIVGSIAFPLLCYFGTAPWVLLIGAAIAIAVLLLSNKDMKLNIKNFAIIAVLIPIFLFIPEQTNKPLIPELLEASPDHTVLWSPYQRLDLTTFSDLSDKSKPILLGLELSANRAFYQYFFSKDALKSKTIVGLRLPEVVKKDYDLALSLNNPKSVLIVGAGTGQNVSAAVDAGLTDIDAVEIDPVILQVGKRFNPDYANPNVHAICDDARHYFSRCQKKYDLVNFATLDSHAVSGLGSSVRLDAYVYTRESFKQALSLLKPGGVLVCSFVAIEPWIDKRLVNTLTEAAGYPPVMLKGITMGRIFILGDIAKNNTVVLPAGYSVDPIVGGGSDFLTDDWPYIYVRNDVVDYAYLLVVGEIVLLSLYATRRFLFKEQDPSSWQMFFLGSAFIILELHAISFLSLVYGSTWITSAIVINGILLMILVANAAVIKFTGAFARHPFVAYVGLLASILLSYFVSSSSSVLHIDTGMAALLTFVSLLPMGMAAIIFANSINATPNLSKSLAFNLFGAVLGGLLEYLSNYWGIKSLLLVSAALYSISAFCFYKHLKQGPPSESTAPDPPAPPTQAAVS